MSISRRLVKRQKEELVRRLNALVEPRKKVNLSPPFPRIKDPDPDGGSDDIEVCGLEFYILEQSTLVYGNILNTDGEVADKLVDIDIEVLRLKEIHDLIEAVDKIVNRKPHDQFIDNPHYTGGWPRFKQFRIKTVYEEDYGDGTKGMEDFIPGMKETPNNVVYGLYGVHEDRDYVFIGDFSELRDAYAVLAGFGVPIPMHAAEACGTKRDKSPVTFTIPGTPSTPYSRPEGKVVMDELPVTLTVPAGHVTRTAESDGVTLKESVTVKNPTPSQLPTADPAVNLRARIKAAEDEGWKFSWTGAGCHVHDPRKIEDHPYNPEWFAWDKSPEECLDRAGVPKYEQPIISDRECVSEWARLGIDGRGTE